MKHAKAGALLHRERIFFCGGGKPWEGGEERLISSISEVKAMSESSQRETKIRESCWSGDGKKGCGG